MGKYMYSTISKYSMIHEYGVPYRTFILCGLSILYFYFSPRWEHSHPGENIPTAVRSGNVLTAVGMFQPRWKYFSPQWECSHRGGNVSTSVEILLTAVGMFSPRWECSHRGGNVLTAVGMFPSR